MRLPPSRPFRRALALGALLSSLAALAGCGQGRDEFAPACPAARPLAEATHLHQYRNPDQAGEQNLAALQFSGVILGVDGKCRPGGNAHTLDATMRLRMQLDRGPAAPPGGIDVPYFVAVARGTQILSKQTFATHVAFPADSDRVVMTSAPIALHLPISGSQGGAAYTIWVGFQLTRAEFAAERGH
jgi:hypothetical protein